MLLLLLTAETCTDGPVETTREDRLSGVFRNIEDEFVINELTYETLNAFGKRAVQKLNDLTDYLNIYADTSLSEEFRFQAREMVLRTFNSEMDLQTYFENLSVFEDTTNILLYFSEDEGVFFTDIDSIKTTELFQKKTISSYTGKLQFTQKIFSINSNDTILANIHKCNIGIIVSKTEKQFGNESQDVWTISFDNIE